MLQALLLTLTRPGSDGEAPVFDKPFAEALLLAFRDLVVDTGQPAHELKELAATTARVGLGETAGRIAAEAADRDPLMLAAVADVAGDDRATLKILLEIALDHPSAAFSVCRSLVTAYPEQFDEIEDIVVHART